MASLDSFAARLVVRFPGGNDIQAILGEPKEWKATYVQPGVGGLLGDNALEVTYDAGTTGVEWLLRECDISVEVNTGANGKWVEPPDSRFINLGSNRDKTARQGRDVKGKLKPYSWLMTKTVIRPAEPMPPIDQRDTRRFRGRVAGNVVNALAVECQSRGEMGNLKIWATSVKDGLGKSWGTPDVNIDFDVGSTFLDVVNQMISEGHMEARMQGRELFIYRPQSFPYETNPTVLRVGEDVLTFDEEIDRSQLATNAMLTGDESTYIRDVASPTLARTAWGKWAVTIQTGGTKRAAMIRSGQNALNKRSKIRVTSDADIVMRPESPFPFRNYSVGDSVTVNPANGPGERVRIVQMEIGRDSNGLMTGHLTFGLRKLATVTKIVNALKVVAPSGVIAAGNGSMATLVKPRPNRYNVAALGADADGIALDDDAVAEIIPQMTTPGDSFFVPVGKDLTITDQLLFNTTVRVEGGGTITQRTPGKAAIRLGPTAHGSIVQDVIINGTGFATLSSGSCGIRMEGTSPAARLRDVLVRNVRINNFQQYGILNELCENLTVEDCEINGMHYAGIMCLSIKGGKITKNNIATINGLTTGAGLSYGIALTKNNLLSEADRPQSSDVLVGFNTVRAVKKWEGLDCHGGQNHQFIGNKVYDCFVGIAAVSLPNAADVATWGPKNIQIIGNEIDSEDGTGVRANGIVLQGAGTVVGEWIDEATGIVASNIVRNHGIQTSDIQGGIIFYWTRDVRVVDNIVYHCAPNGIEMYHTNLGYLIAGNSIIDVWSNVVTAPSAIMIRSNFNTGVVSHNRLSAGNTAGTFKNIYGFNSVQASPTNVAREGGYNDFRQASTLTWRDQSGMSEGGSHTQKWAVRNAAPITVPNITGSRGGNAALGNLLTRLAQQGLLTDSTTV